MKETTVSLGDFDRPVTLVVEPWAVAFEIQRGDRCFVTFRNPNILPRVEVDDSEDTVTLTACEAGSIFEFERNGSLDFEMPIATIPEVMKLRLILNGVEQCDLRDM